MTSVETREGINNNSTDSEYSCIEKEIISRADHYSRAFKESRDASNLVREADFNHRICDSQAHSMHMKAAVTNFQSENVGEMGFQTACGENQEIGWKEAERDSEWAKLQAGVAEAELKRLSLEAERLQSVLEQSENDLLEFLRNLNTAR